MTTERSRAVHDLDVTVWVGKRGTEPAAAELAGQLEDQRFVKTKFLRAARGATDTEELAAELAEEAGAGVVDVRGHTAVFER
jgi:RNA-binding protein